MVKKKPSPPEIRLESFTIQNYRSCVNLHFKPNRDLSVLIGPNAVGKTNLLLGIRLLAETQKRSFGVPARRHQVPLEGSIEAQFIFGKKTVGYRANFAYVTDDRNRDQIINIQTFWNLKSFGFSGDWIDLDEVIEPRRRRRYAHVGALRNWRPEYNSMSHFFDEAVLRSSGAIPEKTTKRQINSAEEAIRQVERFCQRIRYYSASQFADPSRCSSSFTVDEDGGLEAPSIRSREHAQFLYDLYQLNEESEIQYQSYLSLVGRDGMRLIDHVDWRSVEASFNEYEVYIGGRYRKKKRVRKIVIPIVIVQGIRLSFNQLSEGTFKTLASLFYLTTNPGNLLLLEEPEVCVHHGLLESVVSVIKSLSEKKQIIISTHSDLVLDLIEPDKVFVVKKSRTKGTTVASIPEAMSAQRYDALKVYLRSVGNLGDYWKSRGFGA